VRSSAAVVVVVAAFLAGCAREERTLTSADRKACEQLAHRAESGGFAPYDRAFAECVHNTLHPERGGG
jgi:hypothetical protein